MVTDSRSIFLSWEPPLADQQNGILRYYFILLQSDAGTETRNISSSQRSLTVTGLRPFTEYSCTVQAGTVGVGPPTVALQRTTFEDGMYRDMCYTAVWMMSLICFPLLSDHVISFSGHVTFSLMAWLM